MPAVKMPQSETQLYLLLINALDALMEIKLMQGPRIEMNVANGELPSFADHYIRRVTELISH